MMALEEEGYEVDEAESAEQGIERFRSEPPDLVLVDLVLPGASGFDLCREIRASSDVPIIVVSARDDTHDVVAGLEAGADDYVTKPYVIKELAARIRAHIRRTRAQPNAVSPSGTQGAPRTYQFGAVEIVPDAGVVRRNGEELRLTKTEFRVLCELAENSGLVISREQLLERVWGYDYFGDSRLVDAHVRRLRTKIEGEPSEPALIVTVRGLGYKLIA